MQSDVPNPPSEPDTSDRKIVWVNGPVFDRTGLLKMMAIFTPVSMVLLAIPVIFITSGFWGDLTLRHILNRMIALFIFAIIVNCFFIAKNYRYALSSALIPISGNAVRFRKLEYYRDLFDEILKYADPIRHIDSKTYQDQLTYTFPNSSVTIEMMIIKGRFQSKSNGIVLKTIKKRDLPFLMELKELVGMALEIEEPDV